MSLKILTVDDSKTIRMIVARAFQPFDCEIAEAANGVEGLAAAAREKPDLIILDLIMPLMDGVEMLAKLKSDPVLKSIPVIMLTAEAGRENVLKIAKLGVRDYMVKPFKEDALLEKAGRVLNLQVKAKEKKVKTLDDPALILIVDDKPAIIQQITEGISGTPWKVVGKAAGAEAMAEAKSSSPDVIVISLSLPNEEGFNLLQQFRSNPVTRGIPIFGMCVKTDLDLQARAEKSGFAGVITKPIDMESLKTKFIRVMELDVSTKYFSLDGEIQVLTLPEKITDQVTAAVEHYLQLKLNGMVDSGMNKFIMDLSQVVQVEPSLVKMIASTIQKRQILAIKIRIVGSPALKEQFKSFKETYEIKIEPSVAEAKKAFQPAKAS